MHFPQEATRKCTREGVHKPGVQPSRETKGLFRMMVRESQTDGWSVGPKTKPHRVKEESSRWRGLNQGGFYRFIRLDGGELGTDIQKVSE